MNLFKAILFRMEGWSLSSETFGPERMAKVHPAVDTCPEIEALSIASTILSP